MTSIWWIRRDLRLADNAALTAATQSGAVVPCFVLDPAVVGSRYHRHAGRRLAFLRAGLAALDGELRQLGSRLILREGNPVIELARLLQESGADRIYAEEDYSGFARRRDAAVAAALPLTLLPGAAIRRPQDVTKDDGSSYGVFGAYRRRWLTLPALERRGLLPAPGGLGPLDPGLRGIEPNPVPAPAGFPAGSGEAQARLARFTSGPGAPVFAYAALRDRLAADGTSVLSPYLRFGMVSARTLAVEAFDAMQRAPDAAALRGAEAWLIELIWRDFYMTVLHHHPDVTSREFDPRLRHIAWRNDAAELAAWREGRTGYPLVDAAMRQLADTGWLHNRGRMVAASFLVKNLLCDWRLGEQWFMDQLIDGDPAANNGGWQWVAGVGTDAAPYFRVFNPVLQGRRFDPEGAYVRRWLPQLARLDSRYIHEPWRPPAAEQARAGVRIGVDYPAPLVDLAESRDRALAAYRAARDADAGAG